MRTHTLVLPMYNAHLYFPLKFGQQVQMIHSKIRYSFSLGLECPIAIHCSGLHSHAHFSEKHLVAKARLLGYWVLLL